MAEGAVMKVPLLSSSLILSLVLFTGQVRADPEWEQVATNVEKIIALENRINDISDLMGMAAMFMEEDEIFEVKIHGDIYFVYYIAAQVALANEEMEDFEDYIERAGDELDRMMEIIETPPEQPLETLPSPSSTPEMQSL